jgi:predicted ATP-dependent protease
MVFWRSRSAKKAEAPVVIAEEATSGTAAASSTESQTSETQTNVVTLVTTRLADRLAGVATAAEHANSQETKALTPPAVPTEPPPIPPTEQPHVFGQTRAVAKIRAALASKAGEHLLVLGEPGTGRLALAETLAAEVTRQPVEDWIYVIERHATARAKAFAVPSGEGARIARDVFAAIDKANIAFQRHLKSDEHRISLDLLEEEIRYLGDQAVEQVRRRAESQNIAVVKSLDGYVLAPMHEGRVVRSDVFRALPESLKRNVEAKITTLESELQSIVATLPDIELEVSAKYEALMRQTALRAIRPSLAALKRSCADHASAAAAMDAVEEAFISSATSGDGAGTPSAMLLDFVDEDHTEPRKVITARRVSPGDLLGEIGRDATGRPTYIPGHLARAGAGFVIIEAWRLAADPKAWATLSAALASREIAPVCGAGISVKADPVPLTATVIMIADDQSWSKLEAIEPGIARHFPHVAKLAATAAVADMPESEFSNGAASLAADHALKPLATSVAPIIYKDAVRRGGGRVSLARMALLSILREADAIAGGRSASQIRAADVTEALAHRAESDIA